MISDAEIVINRCVKPDCGIVAMLGSRRAGMIFLLAGALDCRKINYSRQAQ